jgi:hypothetical protein
MTDVFYRLRCVVDKLERQAAKYLGVANQTIRSRGATFRAQASGVGKLYARQSLACGVQQFF